jgi:hypothetical protein
MKKAILLSALLALPFGSVAETQFGGSVAASAGFDGGLMGSLRYQWATDGPCFGGGLLEVYNSDLQPPDYLNNNTVNCMVSDEYGMFVTGELAFTSSKDPKRLGIGVDVLRYGMQDMFSELTVTWYPITSDDSDQIKFTGTTQPFTLFGCSTVLTGWYRLKNSYVSFNGIDLTERNAGEVTLKFWDIFLPNTTIGPKVMQGEFNGDTYVILLEGEYHF